MASRLPERGMPASQLCHPHQCAPEHLLEWLCPALRCVGPRVLPCGQMLLVANRALLLRRPWDLMCVTPPKAQTCALDPRSGRQRSRWGVAVRRFRSPCSALGYPSPSPSTRWQTAERKRFLLRERVRWRLPGQSPRRCLSPCSLQQIVVRSQPRRQRSKWADSDRSTA